VGFGVVRQGVVGGEEVSREQKVPLAVARVERECVFSMVAEVTKE
jgi:hypothetical protein